MAATSFSIGLVMPLAIFLPKRTAIRKKRIKREIRIVFIAEIFENIASKGIRLQYVQFLYADLTYETKKRWPFSSTMSYPFSA